MTTKTWLGSNTITGEDAEELKKSEPLRLGILLNPMTFGSENSRRSSIFSSSLVVVVGANLTNYRAYNEMERHTKYIQIHFEVIRNMNEK